MNHTPQNIAAPGKGPANDVLLPADERPDVSAPKVSVIVPVYNVAQYIAETLDSALAQTYRDLEIIVINDGSPDTEELEKALAPYLNDIVYLKQENKGAAASRNTGIKAARGELLAFLDGDDVWKPAYLEKQVSFLAATGSDMVYCDAQLFGDVKKRETFMARSPSDGKVTTASLLATECSVITSGTLVSKEKVAAAGMFDEGGAQRIEDFDLWFRLLKNGAKVNYQKNVLLKYRIREGSLTGTNIEKAERSLIALAEIKRKHTLTAEEESAWQKHFVNAEKHLNALKGKACLIDRKYPEALSYFQNANKPPKKIKLTIITVLLKYAPPLALWVFRTFRADEFSAF